MNYINKFLHNPDIFNSNNKNQQLLFKQALRDLTNYHKKNCLEYSNFVKKINFKTKNINKFYSLPFLPVQIFKLRKLISVKEKQIFKTLSSSGTSSGKKSKIYLDKTNSENQVKVLNKILSQKFGKQRRPMLFIEKDPTQSNKKKFSASLAALYGFSILASKQYYLLNQDGEINYDILRKFMENFSNEKFYIFGFTASVYENFYKKILNDNFDFRNATLIHGGGWKKLENKGVSNNIFKRKIKKKLNISRIYNYYGLIEQTGSIFFECDNGYFVSSIFSDVIVRDKNFNVLPDNQKGLIQLMSVLPTSYPGHNIITEDIGKIIRIKCKCGLKSTHFKIYGRAKEAEIRGCSDAR